MLAVNAVLLPLAATIVEQGAGAMFDHEIVDDTNEERL
jgi:hypothetical protein